MILGLEVTQGWKTNHDVISFIIYLGDYEFQITIKLILDWFNSEGFTPA